MTDDERDAARYRLLRSDNVPPIIHTAITGISPSERSGSHCTPEQIDIAVDEMLSKSK